MRYIWQTMIIMLSLSLGACSVQRMALDQTAALIKQAQPAFESEWDYDLAAAALPGNVKLIEGFLRSGKDNEDLLEMAAIANFSMGLLVLEDQLEQQEEEDSPVAERLRLRAKEMNLRAHRFGLRLADVRVSRFSRAYLGKSEELARALERFEADDVHALVWTAMPLAGAINLGRDDVVLVAQMPRVRAVMERALELDESYFNAAPHLVLGSMFGGVGPMLGGDAKRAKRHFVRALSLTKRRFLLIQVMYAQTLAVQLQDRALFKKLLTEVISAKLEIYPEQKLANVVAKRKARRLLARQDEFF